MDVLCNISTNSVITATDASSCACNMQFVLWRCATFGVRMPRAVHTACVWADCRFLARVPLSGHCANFGPAHRFRRGQVSGILRMSDQLEPCLSYLRHRCNSCAISPRIASSNPDLARAHHSGPKVQLWPNCDNLPRARRSDPKSPFCPESRSTRRMLRCAQRSAIGPESCTLPT